MVPALSGPAVSRTELPEENTDPRPLGGRLCRDLSPLETGIMRNCQASSQRGPGLGLCARGGPAVPASLLRGLCQASSPSSFTLHGGFVKGTIRHSEETTQLPPSLPENKTAPLCANDPPSAWPPPCQGEVERRTGPALWEPGGWCANELSPAPGRTRCPWDAAATLWQRSFSRLLRVMPDQTSRKQRAFTRSSLLWTRATAVETEDSSEV